MLQMPHQSFLPLPSQPMYYEDDFRRVLEDHLFYIRSAADTKVVQIDPGLAWRFEYDFYAFLRYQSVPSHLHWLIMRLTGMYSPDQFTRNKQIYFYPDETLLERIRSNHNSLNRII